MEYRNDSNEELNRRRAKRRRNRHLVIGSLLCLGAAAFYYFASFTSNIQTPPAQSSSTVSASVSVASVPSASSAAVSSKPPASQKPESAAFAAGSESKVENQVTLENAAKPLWIQVSIPDQMVVVYDADNKVVQNYICSTGKQGDDTPLGTYTVKERGKSFFSQQYQEGAYYWTQFQGDFLFHSVPFDKNQNFEPEEAAKLGSEASHGCVRLALENAKWIYDHIPRGTKVVIS